MEICPAYGKTCLFATKKGECTGYRINCIEALTMTAMVEIDDYE